MTNKDRYGCPNCNGEGTLDEATYCDTCNLGREMQNEHDERHRKDRAMLTPESLQKRGQHVIKFIEESIAKFGSINTNSYWSACHAAAKGVRTDKRQEAVQQLYEYGIEYLHTTYPAG